LYIAQAFNFSQQISRLSNTCTRWNWKGTSLPPSALTCVSEKRRLEMAAQLVEEASIVSASDNGSAGRKGQWSKPGEKTTQTGINQSQARTALDPDVGVGKGEK